MSGSIAPRPGGTTRTIGGYDLISEVTRGVLGTLWVARATDAARAPAAALVRRVPVPTGGTKTLDRLVEAAEWGQRGREPGLIAIADVVRERNEVAVVTPFVEGEALRALLRAAAFKRDLFGVDVALRIAVEVLEQLHVVHGRAKYDPMHRAFGGLQPDSVFIGTDGFVRLLDVGLAVAATETSLFDGEAQWLAYACPERFAGKEATAASDVFTVGTILWEMLANRRLFGGATPASVKERVKKGPIERVRAAGSEPIEAAVVDVVAKALERDPAMRYQSAAEMSDALRAAGKLAAPSAIGALVERLAEQFLGKRRALLDKVGLSRAPLDGRNAFLERATPSQGASSGPEGPSGGAGAFAVLAKSSAALGHTPPPPPSRRTSMPPPPPSMRPGAGGSASRADRALALAKAASVAAAPPAPRSAPPPPSAPTPSQSAAPVAPAPPQSESAASSVSPSPPQSVAPAPSAPPAPASEAVPEEAAVASSQGEEPGAPAVDDPAPAAAHAIAALQAPADGAPASAPAAATEAVAAAQPSAASPSAGADAPASLGPLPDGGLPDPALGHSVATGMSPVVASIATGPSALDDDLDVPFARKSAGAKKLWLGAAGGALAVAIIAAVATSGGTAPPEAPAAAQPPVAAAEPEPVVEPPPEPAPPQAAAPAASALEEPPAETDSPDPAPADESKQAEESKPAKRKRRVARAPRTSTEKTTQTSNTPAAAPAPPPSDVGAAFKPGGI